MKSNLLLFVGPLVGLLIARLRGPWRPLSALAAAAVGQLVLFGAYALWQRHRAMRLLAAPPAGHAMVLMARATHPTLGGRLLALSLLLLIAAVVTVLCLGVQFLVMRLSDGPPPAG
jgi:hypothetical protein